MWAQLQPKFVGDVDNIKQQKDPKSYSVDMKDVEDATKR